MDFEYEVFIPDSVKILCKTAKILYKVNIKRKFVEGKEFYNEGIS